MRDPSLTVRRDRDPGLDLDPGLDPVVAPEAMVGLHRVVLRPVGLHQVHLRPVGLHQVHLRPVGRAVLLDLVLTRRPVPVVPDRQRPVGLVVPARQVSLGPMDRVVLVVLVDMDPVGRAVLLDLADRVVPGLMSRVVPVDLDPVGRVGPADPGDRAGPDRTDLADPVDLRRRRIDPEVSTTGVDPNSVARGTRRTASAHPTTVRRLHPRSAGSAGMTGLLPEGLRPTGTGRRLRAAGTDLRLPVAGTVDGTGRHAT